MSCTQNLVCSAQTTAWKPGLDEAVMSWQRIKNPVLPCGEILEVFQNSKVFFVIRIKTDAGDAFEVSERFVNVIPERRQEAVCRLNPEQLKRWLEAATGATSTGRNKERQWKAQTNDGSRQSGGRCEGPRYSGIRPALLGSVNSGQSARNRSIDRHLSDSRRADVPKARQDLQRYALEGRRGDRLGKRHSNQQLRDHRADHSERQKHEKKINRQPEPPECIKRAMRKRVA